ncbi:hypothetical protein ABPG74_006896 [Tetrahymena malaccensis]
MNRDNKNSIQGNVGQYKFLYYITNIDEEQKLLQSVNSSEFCQDNISLSVSFCDESIQLVTSNLLDSKDKSQKHYQHIYQESFKSVNKSDTSKIVDIAKEYVNSFVNLFKWKRDYDSFNQLYFQIGFDSLLAFYFYKKQNKFNSQREQLCQDENIANLEAKFYRCKCLKQFDQFRYEQEAIICIQTSEESKIQENQRNQIIDLNTQEGILTVQVDKDFEYQDAAFPFKIPDDIGLLTKFTASTISFLSGKIFTSKLFIQISNNNSMFTYYLFGEKDLLSNNKIGLIVKSQIKDFFSNEFKFYKLAYLISILVASGISLYFSIKAAKNILYLVNKKILFRKKK